MTGKDKADAWLSASISLEESAKEILDSVPKGCPTHERWTHVVRVVVPSLRRRAEIIRGRAKKP